MLPHRARKLEDAVLFAYLFMSKGGGGRTILNEIETLSSLLKTKLPQTNSNELLPF